MWKKVCLGCVVLFSMCLIVACGGGGTTPGTDPTFATDVKTILDKTCAVAGCHDETKSGGLQLKDATAATLVGAASTGTLKIVEAGKSDSSLLYLKLLDPASRPSGVTVTGGKMPLTGSLTATELDTVKKWIDKGAK